MRGDRFLSAGVGWAWAAVFAAATACGAESGDGGPFELVGVYANSFSEELVLTPTRWGDFSILESDNRSNRLLFEALLPGETAPVYGRIVWTEPAGDGRFFYCFEVSAADSLEAARDARVQVDASDPARRGCGDFAWAQAWPAVDIRGRYVASSGDVHTVTATVWMRGDDELLGLAAWDNELSYVVAQNASNALVEPDRYRLVEWVPANVEGEWFVCDVATGFETARAAYTSTLTADRTDPGSGGCRGDPWVRLRIPRR